MEKTNPYLSVIIPAYNEETRLGRTLEEIFRWLSNQPFAYEILVMCGDAKDRTDEVAEFYKAKLPHLRVVFERENHGKGYVVRKGMLESKGEIRLFTDADNSTSIDHFAKMKPILDQGYDVVIGTRDPRDHPEAIQAVPQSKHKQFAGDLGNLIIQLLVPGIWDTQCGFRALTAKAAYEVFTRAVINSWGFDVEVLGLARKLGFKIGIIPVCWKNDPRSHVKLSGYLDTLFEVVKIWWNLLWNKYGFRAAKAKRCLVDTSRIVRAVDSRTLLFSSALASLSHLDT